jgi:3-methyladenine DNA glycosylase AlkD
MKSEMPFLGVSSPVLRRLWKEAAAAHPPGADWRADVLELWREGEFREERYAALMLLRRRAREADLQLVEELIVDGAWWDYVDSLAHVVGELLRRDGASVADAMHAWSRDENMWKRRVSIICQVGFKGDTDLGLLYDCIEPNLGDREFFVRKAIGWALRDYAWHDPHEIARYVAANEDRLSPLSRREATKNLARLLT